MFLSVADQHAPPKTPRLLTFSKPQLHPFFNWPVLIRVMCWTSSKTWSLTVKQILTGNYRPFSILSSISKIMERLVYDQLWHGLYLSDDKLLHTEYQSGFRLLQSTATALFDSTNQWYFNIDNDLVTSVVFLDLAKAFDTIDHNIKSNSPGKWSKVGNEKF